MMRTQTLSEHSSQDATVRVVLMPGAYHQPEQFVNAGFDAAVRTRSPGVELIVAAPMWLGGVSLGGFMAMRFAAQYPQMIDGLCLLAPYLGSRIIAAEIAALANVTEWDAGILDDDDDERRIWQYVTQLSRSSTATQVFLGYGRDDRFADTQQVLARALPVERTTTSVIDGGHEWPIWRQLWDQFLDRYGRST
jgi:pimeloyl-ACP methyl ester carboxylesterase